MHLKWTLLLTAAIWPFFPAQARAAEVAIMPVQGVNLSAGDCDAMGVLFARAFARDARVAVASPLETKPLLGEGGSAAAVAAQLGAVRYVEMSAIQIGKRINVTGILHARDGAVVFRAETSAGTLDDMDAAIARLSQALVWRQPIPRRSDVEEIPMAQETLNEAPPAPVVPADPNASRGAYGAKAGIALPRYSGKSISPGVFLQFDGRYGPRPYFFEFGAGIMIPTDDQYSSTSIQVTSGFLELGGSFYLWDGPAALYLGAGVSPAIWSSKVNLDTHTSATCSAYGQIGVTFTRDLRFKVFGEFRLSQLLLAVANPISDGTGYATTISDPYRPLMFAFQGGVGF